VLSCKFHGGYHGDIVVLVFLFQTSYCEGMIGHNTSRVLFLFLVIVFFILALVLGRSQVIYLRRSYRDDFSRYFFIIIIRVLFLSIVFPCCWSCSG
jgi:hypothetical protein